MVIMGLLRWEYPDHTGGFCRFAPSDAHSLTPPPSKDAGISRLWLELSAKKVEREWNFAYTEEQLDSLLDGLVDCLCGDAPDTEDIEVNSLLALDPVPLEVAGMHRIAVLPGGVVLGEHQVIFRKSHRIF